MKIRILSDADHRVNSGMSISYKAGTETSAPMATARALIDRGVAEEIGTAKQSTSEEK